jgi:hypothetical protein
VGDLPADGDRVDYRAAARAISSGTAPRSVILC